MGNQSRISEIVSEYGGLVLEKILAFSYVVKLLRSVHQVNFDEAFPHVRCFVVG